MNHKLKHQINIAAILFTLLYLVMALIMSMLFPEQIISYAALGTAIIAGLLQLKKHFKTTHNQ